MSFQKEEGKVINAQISHHNQKSLICVFVCEVCHQSVSRFSSLQALNFRGRLKLVHGQHRLSEDGTLVPPQLALFCVATPMQPPSILEIRTKMLIFQTKHRLDFSPMGIDPRLAHCLSTLNSSIWPLLTQCVFFLCRQREAGSGLLRAGAGHEGFRLQLYPLCRHDVLRRHTHPE